MARALSTRALHERGDVAFFDRLEATAEAVALQTMEIERARKVDARIVIDEELHVGGELDGVIRIGGGERRQAGAIEVDAVVMLKVRILARPCMPPALNHSCRFSSSTLITWRTGHAPLVIWFLTAPVAPSIR